VRANVYVDGFNLYYGIKYYEQQFGKLYKWLDIGALARNERPGDTINHIRYCTARVRPRPNNPDQGKRQEVYIRALRTIPELTVYFGRFLQSFTMMRLRHPPLVGPSFVEVVKMEEKGSDVNLATLMLCDGFANDYDLAILISNDSDLVMPIEVIRTTLKKSVVVLNPGQQYSNALSQVANAYRPIAEQSLAASQFPPTLMDSRGRMITKPAIW